MRDLERREEVAREMAYHAGQILYHYKSHNVTGKSFSLLVNEI